MDETESLITQVQQGDDAALDALTDNGTLAGLEAEWLSATTGVPVIE